MLDSSLLLRETEGDLSSPLNASPSSSLNLPTGEYVMSYLDGIRDLTSGVDSVRHTMGRKNGYLVPITFSKVHTCIRWAGYPWVNEAGHYSIACTSNWLIGWHVIKSPM